MIRRDKARIVCERVAARIRQVSAVGLGNWDLAFELVAEPSDAFMDALREWEAKDCPTTRSKLEATSTDLALAPKLGPLGLQVFELIRVLGEGSDGGEVRRCRTVQAPMWSEVIVLLLPAPERALGVVQIDMPVLR